MKQIEIFDPAMCCSTGLCGTNINPELMRIAVAIETLKRKGINIVRHNLKDEPAEFVSNKAVASYLHIHGVEALPITIVDGEIAATRMYPTNDKLTEWTGIKI